jgi:hypothetical protein
MKDLIIDTANAIEHLDGNLHNAYHLVAGRKITQRPLTQ